MPGQQRDLKCQRKTEGNIPGFLANNSFNRTNDSLNGFTAAQSNEAEAHNSINIGGNKTQLGPGVNSRPDVNEFSLTLELPTQAEPKLNHGDPSQDAPHERLTSPGYIRRAVNNEPQLSPGEPRQPANSCVTASIKHNYQQAS